MGCSKVVRRKKKAQVPFWHPKFDRYDLFCLFRQDPRYDPYDLRFFRFFPRGGEEKWMDPLARKIWEAMISDEKELPPPKKPTWRVCVERLLWLVVVRRLVSEGVDGVWSWLEESLSR